MSSYIHAALLLSLLFLCFFCHKMLAKVGRAEVPKGTKALAFFGIFYFGGFFSFIIFDKIYMFSSSESSLLVAGALVGVWFLIALTCFGEKSK